jgi:hypothetical protein
MTTYYFITVENISLKLFFNNHHINICLKFYGFTQGFVISDWQGIDKITSPPHANYTYSIEAAVNAGLDMVNYDFCKSID